MPERPVLELHAQGLRVVVVHQFQRLTGLQRIEAGDPGCSIGAAFEVAAICGVPLFDASESALASRLSQQTEKLALMPKAVHPARKVVKDDF